jgi:hypothetical protein
MLVLFVIFTSPPSATLYEFAFAALFPLQSSRGVRVKPPPAQKALGPPSWATGEGAVVVRLTGGEAGRRQQAEG